MKLSATHVLKDNKLISRAKFIEIYAQKFGLRQEEVAQEINFLKKKFKVKFTKNGPVIITKLYNSKPEFCWGEYAILVNIYDLDECIAIGGTDPFVDEGSNCIHPNIHVDYNADKFTGYRVCLGYDNKDGICDFIVSGLITSACETIVSILNNTDESDQLFYDFKNIHFKICRYCGDAINADKSTCQKCINDEQDSIEE